MNGERFEKLVADMLQREGYRTKLTSQTNDRGIDVVAKKDGINCAVQAKAYSAENRVGSPAVQKASGLLSRPDIQHVILITTSSFTPEAEKVAENRGVEIISTQANKSSHPQNKNQKYSSSKSSGLPKELSKGRDLNEEIILKKEKQLAEFYEEYVERSAYDGDNLKSYRALSFELNEKCSALDEYITIMGQHSIVCKTESVKLGNRFLKTVEEYGWEVLYTKKGYSDEKDTRERTPPDVFSAVISTNSGDKISPKRQATITKLILDSMYDVDLSGLVVTDSGPDPKQETCSTVLGED